MDVAIMIEGQSGLTWERWTRIAWTVEELGFAALFRSDHFVNPQPPDVASLEAWASITWLASHTDRIQFGPLVSPLTVRHPSVLARMAAAVDDLSGGRLVLGLGAGWSEREHENYGFELPPTGERFDRLEEGLEVITRLLGSDEPTTYRGRHFWLNDAILLPRPQRPGGPPILLGGKGRTRTLPLVARYADQWNALFVSPDQFADLSGHLDTLLEGAGRQPTDVVRSVMVGVEVGTTDAEVRDKLAERNWEWRRPGLVAGTPDEVAEQLASFARAGAQRVMLQWMDQDDLEGLGILAEAVP